MTTQKASFKGSEVVLHLLDLIAESDHAIQFFQNQGQELMVRQYQHLRGKDLEQLNKIFREAGMHVQMIVAAES
jgi:hypothetical protein